jgi:hypothetical protein
MKWIDVADRLPAEGFEVLAMAVYDGHVTYWLARYLGAEFWVDDDGVECLPSHWMLLPDAPMET